jgi:hypothetical protein
MWRPHDIARSFGEEGVFAPNAVVHVKNQPVRERFVWPFYELDKGIYSFWKTK